jgi:hypothetical protein
MPRVRNFWHTCGNREASLTKSSACISRWRTSESVVTIMLTHAGGPPTMAPSHDNLLGTHEQRAYAPGGRTPSGERDWRSWPCDSCIASPLFVALDLHGTAGSPGRLRTAFVPLSRAPSRLRRRVTRSPRAAPPGQVRAACAGSRGQVCRSIRLRHVAETAAPTCRRSGG